MSPLDEKLGHRDAALYLGIAPATLAKMRCLGGSPIFLRLGRKIVFACTTSSKDSKTNSGL